MKKIKIQCYKCAQFQNLLVLIHQVKSKDHLKETKKYSALQTLLFFSMFLISCAHCLKKPIKRCTQKNSKRSQHAFLSCLILFTNQTICSFSYMAQLHLKTLFLLDIQKSLKQLKLRKLLKFQKNFCHPQRTNKQQCVLEI